MYFVLQAIWVSDMVLGERSSETRAAFIAQLQAECTEASPEDVQWQVKAAEPSAGLGPQLFKPKPSFGSSPAREQPGVTRSTTDSTSKLLLLLLLLLLLQPLASSALVQHTAGRFCAAQATEQMCTCLPMHDQRFDQMQFVGLLVWKYKGLLLAIKAIASLAMYSVLKLLA